MKSLVYILFFVSLFANICWADEGLVCFPKSEAKNNMLISLEQNSGRQDVISSLQEENQALRQQNDLLKQNNILLKEQVTQTKEMMQVQKESYESIIKANKPNPFKEIVDRFGYIGIGVLAGLALAL